MLLKNEAQEYTLESLKNQKAVSRANYLLRTIEFRVKRLTPKGIYQLKLFYKDDLAHQIIIAELNKSGYTTEFEINSKRTNLVVSWDAATKSNLRSPQ